MDNVWKQLYLNKCKVFWVPHDSPAGYSGTVVVIHLFRNPLNIKDSHKQAFKALVIPQLLLKAVWVPCQMCCMLESHNTSMSSHIPRVLCNSKPQHVNMPFSRLQHDYLGLSRYGAEDIWLEKAQCGDGGGGGGLPRIVAILIKSREIKWPDSLIRYIYIEYMLQLSLSTQLSTQLITPSKFLSTKGSLFIKKNQNKKHPYQLHSLPKKQLLRAKADMNGTSEICKE